MLSVRLQAVADMVTQGNIIADIGTDHGYVPIYLVENRICPMAYAMDINEGPIQRARDHIEGAGLLGKIKVIQSNGMEKLKPGQADTVVIAGMGGELIIDILKASEVNDTVKELVLSPHRRGDLVRRFLNDHGWRITEENMVLDVGKFYTIIKAVHGEETEAYSEIEFIYGRCLLNEKNTVLYKYLNKEYKKFLAIKDNMETNSNQNIKNIERILEYNRKAREMYD